VTAKQTTYLDKNKQAANDEPKSAACVYFIFLLIRISGLNPLWR